MLIDSYETIENTYRWPAKTKIRMYRKFRNIRTSRKFSPILSRCTMIARNWMRTEIQKRNWEIEWKKRGKVKTKFEEKNLHMHRYNAATAVTAVLFGVTAANYDACSRSNNLAFLTPLAIGDTAFTSRICAPYSNQIWGCLSASSVSSRSPNVRRGHEKIYMAENKVNKLLWIPLSTRIHCIFLLAWQFELEGKIKVSIFHVNQFCWLAPCPVFQ